MDDLAELSLLLFLRERESGKTPPPSFPRDVPTLPHTHWKFSGKVPGE
jgi:hypothetical protein